MVDVRLLAAPSKERITVDKMLSVIIRFGEVGKMPYLKEVMHMSTKDVIETVKKAFNNK